MKRQGNMLVMTLVACALLALLLVTGVEVLNLKEATSNNELDALKLEQLHRTALQDGMRTINARGIPLREGEVLLEDAPCRGQTRKLTVASVTPPTVVLHTEVRLDNGGARFHSVELFMTKKEARMGLTRGARALFFDRNSRDVSNRWLENHREADIFCLCDGGLTIGSGGALKTPLMGSLILGAWEGQNAHAFIDTDLSLKGNVVVYGNLSLRHDLSCETAWIDGTLTIDEGIKLEAKKVFLANQTPIEVLERINGKIYMPLPEGTGTEGAKPHLDVLPLPEGANPETDRVFYLVLQQLD